MSVRSFIQLRNASISQLAATVKNAYSYILKLNANLVSTALAKTVPISTLRVAWPQVLAAQQANSVVLHLTIFNRCRWCKWWWWWLRQQQLTLTLTLLISLDHIMLLKNSSQANRKLPHRAYLQMHNHHWYQTIQVRLTSLHNKIILIKLNK